MVSHQQDVKYLSDLWMVVVIEFLKYNFRMYHFYNIFTGAIQSNNTSKVRKEVTEMERRMEKEKEKKELE